MPDAPSEPVTVVVSMRNAGSTILPCLKELAAQDYPIAEIMVVDNVSTDDSAAQVEAFAGTAPVPVRLIRKTVDALISGSYNTGVAEAHTALVVFVHADSALPTPHELERLVRPLLQDARVVGSCPRLLMPPEVWERFPFWQRALFARAACRENHSMCGKFDAVRRDVYLAIGGYNARRFSKNCGYGGEDADFRDRLQRAGTVARSDARVIHLHDLSGQFGLADLFRTRRLLGRTYGKVLRFQKFWPLGEKVLFFVRPVLAILPFVPHLHLLGLLALLAFGFINSRAMYASRITCRDPRILMLPVVDLLLVYWESYWLAEGILTPAADAAYGVHASSAASHRKP